MLAGSSWSDLDVGQPELEPPQHRFLPQPAETLRATKEMINPVPSLWFAPLPQPAVTLQATASTT